MVRFRGFCIFRHLREFRGFCGGFKNFGVSEFLLLRSIVEVISASIL